MIVKINIIFTNLIWLIDLTEFTLNMIQQSQTKTHEECVWCMMIYSMTMK